MRVITGSCKGRKLKTASGLNTRPTSDMLKGMLFNILSWKCEDAVVLDLCAGSGALGIEALSRGARFATFLEADRDALSALKDNLKTCAFEERSELLAGDILRLLPLWRPKWQPSLVFFDPPYTSDLYLPVLKMIDAYTWFDSEAILIVEHHKKERMPEMLGRLRCVRETGHGQTCLSFFSAQQDGG